VREFATFIATFRQLPMAVQTLIEFDAFFHQQHAPIKTHNTEMMLVALEAAYQRWVERGGTELSRADQEDAARTTLAIMFTLEPRYKRLFDRAERVAARVAL